MIKATFMNTEKEEKMVGWGESVVLNIPIELIPLPAYGKEIKFFVNSSELYKCQDIINGIQQNGKRSNLRPRY